FTLHHGGTFRIDLESADGLRARNAAHGKLILLRDEKPVVSISQPGMNALATPAMKIPLRVEAEDDIGIQRIELHRIVNDGTDFAAPIQATAGPHVDAAGRMDLSQLNAKPGDVIRYWATAYDSDPGRSHTADSDRYWIWVVSKEDYRKALERQRGLP